jgi:ankyrin repeat protein
VVALLLAAGENPKAKYDNDLTALMWAAAYGHTATAKVLLERGAEVGARDNRGKSALAMALEGGHKETEALLRRAGAKD